MHKHLTHLVLMALVLTSLGCAPNTLSTAERGGKSALDARQIFDLVSGNTMQLTAYDFTGQIYFQSDGRLAGRDFSNQHDSGSWDISEENRLCLKFRLWYYGDIKCYSLVPAQGNDAYSFFTPNGAAYYTGVLQPGDVAGLTEQIEKQIKSEKPSRYLREELASGNSKATAGSSPAQEVSQNPETISHSAGQVPSDNTTTSVRRLAKDCPGCNLAGADLKEIELVNANLAGADLSRADLRYSNLRRANLAGADLSNARLNYANLPGADMRGCNLKNADLSGANLLLADLTGADLTGANMSNAHIENAKGIEK